MKTLIHYFTLIVGDLVPVGNMVWQYMTTLIKIIDILLESDFDSSILIKEHNED